MTYYYYYYFQRLGLGGNLLHVCLNMPYKVLLYSRFYLDVN